MHCVLVKDFCCYYLQALCTEKKKLKCHVKDGFKINSKQMIKTPKKVNMLDVKILKEILNHD